MSKKGTDNILVRMQIQKKIQKHFQHNILFQEIAESFYVHFETIQNYSRLKMNCKTKTRFTGPPTNPNPSAEKHRVISKIAESLRLFL